MDINYFDLIAAAIILLLGLKGILNGFFKELFGLIGIIGGIFIASRVGDGAGKFLNDNIFHFESHAVIAFAGFILVLALFWLAMIGLGHLFKKLGALSGLGALDRVAGFALGSGKFFLIAAVIAFAINNIRAVRENLEGPMENSVLFPIFVATGSYIMKVSPDSLKEEVESSVEVGKVAAGNITIEHTGQLIQAVSSQLKENKD